jgi:hypothetical protein
MTVLLLVLLTYSLGTTASAAAVATDCYTRQVTAAAANTVAAQHAHSASITVVVAAPHASEKFAQYTHAATEL